MRKQKLNKLDKSGSTRNGEEELKVEQFNRSEEDVDKLKSIENKAEVQDEHIKVTSSKKKSDNTLLRFFSVKSVTKSGPASEPEKVPGGSSL